MRILAIDFGDSRTGFAVSDPSCFLASAIGTLHERNMDKVADHAAKYADEYKISEIVLGFPLNMNNTMGERAKRTMIFKDKLSALLPEDVKIILWDERGSTVSAINILNQTNTRGKKRKEIVDSVAAVIILQSYLDYKKR